MNELWPPANESFPYLQLDEFLMWCVERKASDITFQTRRAAYIEVHGKLGFATHAELNQTDLIMIINHLYGHTAEQVVLEGKAIDCAHIVEISRSERQRFRVNISPVEVNGTKGINVTVRVVDEKPPSFEELRTEQQIIGACRLCTGLTLITGIPGSGKTTLMAAITRDNLENDKGKILAFDSPIEFTFGDIKQTGSLISQSEIPRDFPTFAMALRSALRRRPKIITIGEMRDLETIEAGINAADFGVATYGTVHTIGVSNTIRRVLSEFPEIERPARGAAMVDMLNLVVSQQLVPNPKEGLTALKEWLVFNRELKDRLLRADQCEWATIIQDVMAANDNTTAAAATKAFQDGNITEADFLRFTADQREVT